MTVLWNFYGGLNSWSSFMATSFTWSRHAGMSESQRMPPSLLYNRYRVSFPWVKRPGRGVDHPPQSSAKDKERVQLYSTSPLGLRGLLQGELYLYLTGAQCRIFWTDTSDIFTVSVDEVSGMSDSRRRRFPVCAVSCGKWCKCECLRDVWTGFHFNFYRVVISSDKYNLFFRVARVTGRFSCLR